MNRKQAPELSPIELLKSQEQTALERYNGLSHNYGLNPRDAELRESADAAYAEWQRIKKEIADIEERV
ncbi:MAG: hypothetical protein WCX08_03365 [Candidatus Buchananbacteria bacterium]|jgi:hypothetical protein